MEKGTLVPGLRIVQDGRVLYPASIKVSDLKKIFDQKVATVSMSAPLPPITLLVSEGTTDWIEMSPKSTSPLLPEKTLEKVQDTEGNHGFLIFGGDEKFEMCSEWINVFSILLDAYTNKSEDDDEILIIFASKKKEEDNGDDTV